MTAADWLTSDAVTEALASIKRENDTERSLEREAFEAWVNNECDYQPWEGDAGHSHCACGAELAGDGRITGQCWPCFHADD